MYEQMDRHLMNTAANMTLPQIIRSAASMARVKLTKYKMMADNNQYYIIGTGMYIQCMVYYVITQLTRVAVLHPYLRAEWFKETAPKPDRTRPAAEQASAEAVQKAAVEKAKTLFTHVAQTYYENPPTVKSTPSMAPTTAQQDHKSASTWLNSICAFEVAEVPVAEASQDRLQDELRRYFKFEGGRGEISNPLGWWKVS
jgi:hypothetical protein